MSNKEIVLAVKDLDITFKTAAGKVHAIRGVNFTVHKGETVAIVGESGSGKSVTMKAAMGIRLWSPGVRAAAREAVAPPASVPAARTRAPSFFVQDMVFLLAVGWGIPFPSAI